MHANLSSPVFNQRGCSRPLEQRVHHLFRQASSISLFEKVSALWGSGRKMLSTLAEGVVGGEQVYIGRKSVQLTQIQGSCNVGRCQEFDATFQPARLHSPHRWYSIAIARLQGKKLPPILLVQVEQSYFVTDGHHRVSVARALGDVEIEADVARCYV